MLHSVVRHAGAATLRRSGQPRKDKNVIVPKEYHASEAMMVCARIISRKSWDDLQAMHLACPGSSIEHVAHGIYVLHIPAGGAMKVAA